MKNLLKANLILIFLLSFLVSYGQSVRNVDSFSKIKASTSVKVKLIKGDKQRVEFKMLKGDESRLVTEVKDDQLIIKIKSKTLSWGNNAKAAVKVYYTLLTDIEASAGATIKADEPIVAGDMDVESSSGSTIDIEVEAQSIDAEATSGSRLVLEGSAKSGEFEVSSGAKLDASDLICERVDADASSGGNLRVHADKKLNADASSGGSIKYKGSVENVNTDSGWSGKVKRMK